MATQQELIEAENNLRNLGLLNNQGSLQPNLGLQSNLGLLSAQNPMQASLQNSLTAPGGVFSGNTPGGAFSQMSNNAVNPPPKKRGVGGFFRDAIGLALNPNFVENRQMRELIDSQNVPQQTKDLLKLLSRNEQIEYLTGEGKGNDRRIVVQDGIQYYVDTGKPVLTDVVAQPKSGGTMYQIVDGNNNDSFVGNISANDLAAVGFEKYKEQGIDTTAFKLTALPTGSAPADTSGDTDFDALKGRFMATNTLINNLGGLAQNYFDNPKSALAIGGASQFVDSIIQNVDAAGEMLSGKDYTNLQNSGFTTIEGNDFSSKLKKASQATGVSESRVRDLAYLFAAARGQTGRGLSDKDYENALRIVSGGVGAEGKIKVLEDVAVRIGSEVQGDLDFTVRNLPEGTAIDKYTKLRGSLPTFVNPYASSTNKNNDPLGIR
tara:strand:- start:2179 stop:3480 length:1302 start_codon:yes stop_codon:yes gene_type:complete